MTEILVRRLLLATATLQAVYVLIVVGIYHDLTSRIHFPILRLLATFVVFGLIFNWYETLLEPETIHALLPFQSGSVRHAFIAQVMPLVLESIRVLLVTSAQISVIDKLLYIVARWRIPQTIAIGIAAAMAATGALVIYTALAEPRWRVAEVMAQLDSAETYIIEPLAAIMLLLLAATTIKGAQSIGRHIRDRRAKK